MLFGPSKNAMKSMLVDCWNTIARSRGEQIRYVSIKDGFEWFVVIHNKLDDDAQEIMVVLLDSYAEGKRYLEYAKANPDWLNLWSVRKSLGPVGRSDTENIGLRSYQYWLDALYRDESA